MSLDRRTLLLTTLLLPLLAASGAQAQPAPIVVNVQLSDYKYEPKVIEFNRGQAYLLHITNSSNKVHGLEAKAFFDTVTYPDWSKGRVKKGDIEVWPGQWADVAFTPQTSGEFEMHCPHPMNVMMGMTGQIVVR